MCNSIYISLSTVYFIWCNCEICPKIFLQEAQMFCLTKVKYFCMVQKYCTLTPEGSLLQRGLFSAASESPAIIAVPATGALIIVDVWENWGQNKGGSGSSAFYDPIVPPLQYRALDVAVPTQISPYSNRFGGC